MKYAHGFPPQTQKMEELVADEKMKHKILFWVSL